MTLRTDDDPNRTAAPAFDFLISQQSAPVASHHAPAAAVFGFEQRPRAEQRRRNQVDARAVTGPLIITALIVLLIGGVASTWFWLVQSSEAEVKADSAAMCAELATTPGVLEQPGFGWPTDGANLTTTLELMKDYRKRWAAIAASAAPTIQPDVQVVVTAAKSIIENIEISKSIDRPASLATMQSVTSATAIAAWAGKYCG